MNYLRAGRCALLWLGLSGCGSDFEPSGPSCGNRVIDPGELCDGDNLANQDCRSVAAEFTSGALACSASCDSWDTSACVAGEGQVTGTISLGPSLSCDAAEPEADCVGAVWVLVVTEDPATNLAQTPIASTTLAAVDLSGGAEVPYTIPAVREGSWFIAGFMDDDENASAVMPGPDAGDPVSFPAMAIEVEHEGTTQQNIVLNMAMP